MTKSSKSLIIIKIGGSIITNDLEFETFQKELATNLMKSINTLTKDYNFVIIHGAGSFGHIHAKAFDLKHGFSDRSQLIGVVKTHESMLKLNNHLRQSTQSIEGIFPVSFSPLSLCTTSNGRIQRFDLTSLRLALKMGFMPILFGDVVFDNELGFTILSGDQITPFLATELHADQIIMLTDVSGVYDDNPKTNPGAQLLPQINLQNTELLNKISLTAESGKTRVTGEMEKKLFELKTAVEKGIPTWIMSGLDPQNLVRHLGQKKQIGTKLVSIQD